MLHLLAKNMARCSNVLTRLTEHSSIWQHKREYVLQPAMTAPSILSYMSLLSCIQEYWRRWVILFQKALIHMKFCLPKERHFYYKNNTNIILQLMEQLIPVFGIKHWISQWTCSGRRDEVWNHVSMSDTSLYAPVSCTSAGLLENTHNTQQHHTWS